MFKFHLYIHSDIIICPYRLLFISFFFHKKMSEKEQQQFTNLYRLHTFQYGTGQCVYAETKTTKKKCFTLAEN